MDELVMVNEEAGHADLVVSANQGKVMTSPKVWPKCEDEPESLLRIFEDDLDQSKLTAYLDEARKNPFIEIVEFGLVIPDGEAKIREAKDESSRRHYEVIGKRTSAVVRAFGQVRNPARAYSARATRNANWNLAVDVFREGERIGGYQRNYGSLFQGFYPFVWKGQHYALYSPDYTAIRILSLPDCQDVGGEEPHPHNFCPVDFYLPCDPVTGESCGFGFVSGCVWGDDSSWKLEYLDLSEVHLGKLSHDARFGYVELPEMELWEAVKLDWGAGGARPWVSVVMERRFNLTEQKWADE